MKLSIRINLTIWYCIVFCLSVCILELGVYVGLNSAMNQSVDRELRVRSKGLDEFLQEHLARLPMARVRQELMLHATLQPELTVLQDGQGRTLFCGASVQALCRITIIHPPVRLLADNDLRAIASELTVGGVKYSFLVATDLRFQHQLLGRFKRLCLLIIPLTIGCTAFGAYWISGIAFRPVREIISSVRAINERSLSVRLRVFNTGDEIQQLSETLNSMLARVDNSFRKVTELTENASHELRTPLAIIRTASEVALLDSRPTIDSHRTALLQICNEAEKTTLLLDSLLVLARADSGTESLHLKPMSLQESMHKAVDACRYLAADKAIDMRMASGTKDVIVWADPVQLHRLWLLLIDNAIKYTPREGTVRTAVVMCPSGAAAFEVSDSGIGISGNDLPNIFDRLFRAENARAHSEKGAGLGLTMGQWIATAHHAQFDVNSGIGKGSTFRVIFPADHKTIEHLMVPSSALTG